MGDETFGERMLGASGPELKRQIDLEVRLLARTFAPDGDPASLDAAADALGESAATLGHGRRHVLLWAAGFRRLARGETS